MNSGALRHSNSRRFKQKGVSEVKGQNRFYSKFPQVPPPTNILWDAPWRIPPFGKKDCFRYLYWFSSVCAKAGLGRYFDLLDLWFAICHHQVTVLSLCSHVAWSIIIVLIGTQRQARQAGSVSQSQWPNFPQRLLKFRMLADCWSKSELRAFYTLFLRGWKNATRMKQSSCYFLATPSLSTGCPVRECTRERWPTLRDFSNNNGVSSPIWIISSIASKLELF